MFIKRQKEKFKKVLFVLHNVINDYYFVRLDDALRNLGIMILYSKKIPRFLPLFRNTLLSKCKLLHIHWIFAFAGFNTKSRIKFPLKFFLFIIDTYLIKYLLKTKIIYTVHNLYGHESYYPRIEKLGRKFFYNKVDVVTSHCPQAKKEIQKEFGVSPNKIHVIPHGNYFNCYENKASKSEARNFLNLDENDFIFLHFGRIRPYKGVETLIRSFKSLKISENIKLLIVGETQDKQYEKEILDIANTSDNIIIKFEYVPDSELQFYMNASDIVVNCYRRILTSGEVILAMTFAKPIIAPRLGCIIDILDEKGSFLYDPTDKNGLSKTLEEAINRKHELTKMGSYNLDLAKKYDWKIIGKKFEEIYRNIKIK
ncbi:MAG: glycosyltransferase family 4 protein [Candidatus Hodarchaeota archaeon]